MTTTRSARATRSGRAHKPPAPSSARETRIGVAYSERFCHELLSTASNKTAANAVIRIFVSLGLAASHSAPRGPLLHLAPRPSPLAPRLEPRYLGCRASFSKAQKSPAARTA